MRKFLVILGIVCFYVDSSIAIERCNTLSKSDIYTSNEKYRNPFPYDIELKSNNIKYNWNGSSIIARFEKKKTPVEHENFIENIPNIIYDFKKKFHENSENYFKYLLNKSYDDIDNNIIPKTNNGILETYNNPFKKNPFIFKIEDEVFQWKDSKIFINKYCNKYNSRLNNILIDFNNSFEYFIYLIQKFIKLKSYKIDINIKKCSENIYSNYSNLTLETPSYNPLDDNLMIVIKDCIRTYRWHNNTIEILFPNWLNDNLSQNKYSIFLQLIEKATKDFNKNTKHKKRLEDFEYFINKELGNNIIVYALNMDNLGWENITSNKTSYISTVTNHNTGFVEIDKISTNYNVDNDEDDF